MKLFTIKEPQRDVAEIIQRRRLQVLVHSLLYYELDTNLVTDQQWTAWAKELAQLQLQHPERARSGLYAEAFQGFEGASGFNLPFRDVRIVRIARDLLIESTGAEKESALEKLGRVVSFDYGREKKKFVKEVNRGGSDVNKRFLI